MQLIDMVTSAKFVEVMVDAGLSWNENVLYNKGRCLGV